MEYAMITIVAVRAVQDSLDSSDDDSSDDEDLIYCFGNRAGQNVVPRTQNYVEAIVFQMADDTLKVIFDPYVIALTSEKQQHGELFGAVDGTHRRIAQPKEHHASYIDRKGFHSIQTQLVCDHKLKFIHAYCCQAGSVHDARVFRLSNLQSYCTPDFFS